MKVIVTRRISAEHPHNFLYRDVEKGEVFYLFHKNTYGCIDDDYGVALSEVENEYPFFEFPRDAVAA